MSKQYYWALRECPAKSSDDPNCICWHDEGTGPEPASKFKWGDGYWRDKPETSTVEQAIRAVWPTPEIATFWASVPTPFNPGELQPPPVNHQCVTAETARTLVEQFESMRKALIEATEKLKTFEG